ncbi:MAG: ATP-binding cassette domain-containing protein [Kordiimonadaceae bacterium]|nr:ATP-binding cassette domain-containing protein [Kordiimonadaceae bacterium]
MSSYSVTFNNISKTYGDITVLDKVDLNITQNETTALVGESGSGKTTLLQIVNGLVRPTAGHVAIFDQKIDYDDLPSLRKKMGYAVQGAGLFPHMTVYENITVMAKLSGWNDEEINLRANFVIEVVDLMKELLERFPHNLSGGQQQRVSLCRAMMLNPPLLLLDEPFSALDPITKSYIHAEFEKLQKAEARTILLVTHDMEEAVKLAENIVVIQNGKIIQHGKTEDIINAPFNSYVEELLSGITS